MIERAHGVEPSQQTCFHVARTGSEQFVTVPCQGTLCGGAPRVDGVGMAEEQHAPHALSLAAAYQIIAPSLLPPPLDGEAKSPQLSLQPVLNRVNPFLVVTAGVDRRQMLQIG